MRQKVKYSPCIRICLPCIYRNFRRCSVLIEPTGEGILCFLRNRNILMKIRIPILTGKNQLKHMARYIMDNPRRLALKRANRNLFRIRQNVTISDIPCTTLGNMFLAEYPQRQLLQCSRKLTSEQITAYKEVCLAEAANGTVFITAAISEGEKVIARALREEGYPIIILLEKGFPSPDSPHYRYFKPQGVYFEACAMGKLLLVEPKADTLERQDIVERVVARIGNIPHETQRYRFVAMNVIAEHMCYDSAEQRRGQDG